MNLPLRTALAISCSTVVFILICFLESIFLLWFHLAIFLLWFHLDSWLLFQSSSIWIFPKFVSFIFTVTTLCSKKTIGIILSSWWCWFLFCVPKCVPYPEEYIKCEEMCALLSRALNIFTETMHPYFFLSGYFLYEDCRGKNLLQLLFAIFLHVF